MAIATLTIDVVAKLANIESDLGKVSHLAEQAGNRMTSAFASLKTLTAGIGLAALTSELAHFIQGAIDAQDRLHDLSLTTRLSVVELSGLALAAKQSGSDLDGAAHAIDKLAVNMGKNAEKFASIGITAKDPLTAFEQLADVMNAIDDPQRRAAVGAIALGKGWEIAAPLLALGSKRIQELIKHGENLSHVTTESAAKADEFNDKLSELKALAGGWAVSAANPLVSWILDVNHAMEAGVHLSDLWSKRFIQEGTQNLSRDTGIKRIGGAAPDATAKKPTNSALDNFISANENFNKMAEAQLAKQNALYKKIEDAYKANQDHLKSLRAQGLILEEDELKRSHELALKKLDDQRIILESELSIAQKANVKHSQDKNIEQIKGAIDLNQQNKAQENAGYIDKVAEALANAKRELGAFEGLEKDSADAINFQTGMLGKNKLAIDELTAARQIDLEVRQRTTEAFVDENNHLQWRMKVSPELAALYKAEGEAAKTAINKALEAQKELDAHWETGATNALTAYLDEIQNVAKSSEQLFTNAFHGMEDAIVTFVTTGKLSFTSLANTIVAQITRIIVEQQISNAMGVAGISGGGANLLGMIANVYNPWGSANPSSPNMVGPPAPGRAIGGSVEANRLYQVNERGPELLNYSGRDYLMMGGSGGYVKPINTSSGNSAPARPISLVQHFAITGPADSRTQGQIASAAYAGAAKAFRRNS